MQNGNDGFNFQRGNRNEQGVFAEVSTLRDTATPLNHHLILHSIRLVWISNVKANVISNFSFPSQSNFTVASATMLYVKYETKTFGEGFLCLKKHLRNAHSWQSAQFSTKEIVIWYLKAFFTLHNPHICILEYHDVEDELYVFIYIVTNHKQRLIWNCEPPTAGH